MPGWRTDSSGKLELFFVNADDMENFLKTVVVPTAADPKIGIEVTYARPTKAAGPEPLLETSRL